MSVIKYKSIKSEGTRTTHLDTLGLVNCFEIGLSFVIVDHVFGLFLFEFDQNGLIQHHFVGGEEGADESTTRVEYFGDKGISW